MSAESSGLCEWGGGGGDDGGGVEEEEEEEGVYTVSATVECCCTLGSLCVMFHVYHFKRYVNTTAKNMYRVV